MNACTHTAMFFSKSQKDKDHILSPINELQISMNIYVHIYIVVRHKFRNEFMEGRRDLKQGGKREKAMEAI
jgi:hypothetical protein